MPNFRCPHCGSPVMIRGHRWECGWCGDSGEFGSQHGNNDASIESALEDLEQGVYAILNGMECYYHNEEVAKTPTWELTAYGITSALLKVGRVKSEAVRLLQAFYQRYPVCTAEDILSAVRQGTPAFASKYRLSALAVGGFWNHVPPAALRQILDGLCQVWSLFSGEDPEQLLTSWKAWLDQ